MQLQLTLIGASMSLIKHNLEFLVVAAIPIGAVFGAVFVTLCS